jgi:3',5'-cyclic AMP phosphodiesterase CpdA
MTRHIIIGDVHGCAAELKTLLEKLDATPDDIIISLGDITDKGPESVEALNLLYDYDAVLVDSNHDQRYKKYLEKGLTAADVNAKNIKDEYKAEYSKIFANAIASRALLDAVPFSEITVAGQLFTFVHAGVTPYMDMYDIDTRHWGEFLRVRYLNADTHGFIRMVKIDKDKYPDEVASWRPEHDNVIEWQKAYDNRYGIIVHGHIIVGPNPHMWVGKDPQKHEIGRWKDRFDINLLKKAQVKAFSLDTGAHKGWNLTALVIEEDSEQAYFEQVEVKTCYEP